MVLISKDHFRDEISVHSLSCVQLFATPWTAAHQASLSITNSWSLPKLVSLELVMPSNHFVLCHPLLFLPSIFPSIRVFSNESVLHIRWPKYWSFSLSVSPSNEHPGLISFRKDWLDIFTVQGTLKSLLQHHNSKVSILQCSAFFILRLSHSYMTTGKTVALFYECFKPAFSLSSVTIIKRLISSPSLSTIREVSSAYLTFTRLLSRNSACCMLLVAPEIKVDRGVKR